MNTPADTPSLDLAPLQAQVDTLSRYVTALGQSDSGLAVADLQHNVERIDRSLADLRRERAAAIPPPGVSRAEAKKIANEKAQFWATAVAEAVGEQLKTLRDELTSRIDSTLGAVQSSAETARAASRSSLESSVAILEHSAYALRAVEDIAQADTAAEAAFNALSRTIKDIRWVDEPPPAASPGEVVKTMLTLEKHPNRDPEAVAEVALFDARKAIDAINDRLDASAAWAATLSQVAGFIRGQEPLPEALPDSIQASAISLNTGASTGFPAAAVADKLAGLCIQYMSEIRAYQGRLTERRKSALGVSAAVHLGETYARLAKESVVLKTRSTFSSKATHWAAAAETSRQEHRNNFPRMTR